jgi:hypothetical protein
MQTEPLGACTGPVRREAPTPENSGGCAYCPADAHGLDARLGEPTCAECANRPIVIPDGGDKVTDRLTEEIERTVRDVLDETAYQTPDDRPIDDITTVDQCQSCGLMPAPVILTNGDSEGYNCGRNPDEAYVTTSESAGTSRRGP